MNDETIRYAPNIDKPRIVPMPSKSIGTFKYRCENRHSCGTGYSASDAYAKWWNAECASGRLHPMPRGDYPRYEKNGRIYISV